MKDTLIGIVLGDGYLEPHGRGVRLQVLHSAAHRPYVEWKWTELMELQPSPLHYQENGGYPFWRFVTKCHPILKDLRSSFYRDGRKVVPDTIGELLVRPKSLAVWFMDDGTIDRRQGSVLFETQCFSTTDIERLREVLRVNFSLQASVHRSGRGRGYRLYIPVREAARLARIISPYVLPELRYKLPFPVTTEGDWA